MRQTKDITITEDGNEYKFRITAMSAIRQEKWGIKVGVLLASSGLLEFDLDNTAVSLDGVFSAITKKGLGFLGKLDPDKTSSLLFEIIEECVTRIDGAGSMKVDEKELDNLFSDVRSLVTLQKEVFLVNFHSFMDGNQLNTPTSVQTENATSKRGISVEPLHR